MPLHALAALTARYLERGVEILSGPGTAVTAQTPKRAVAAFGRSTLYRYDSPPRNRRRTPLLLVYALVNKPAILDLMPGRSVVETLLREGRDVFLLDWGTPAAADAGRGLEDHVLGTLDGAMDAVLAASRRKKAALAGYCMGGTLSVLYAALRPAKVERLLVMAAPIAGRIPQGALHAFSHPALFNPAALNAGGLVPPEALNFGFSLLRPVENLWGKYVRYCEQGEDPAVRRSFAALERWLRDGVPLPGAIYEEFVRGIYQDDALQNGGLAVGAETADPAAIRCPLGIVVAEQDHLVPPASTLALAELTGSKSVKIFRFPGGHVGLAVSGRAHRALWPEIARWLPAALLALLLAAPASARVLAAPAPVPRLSVPGLPALAPSLLPGSIFAPGSAGLVSLAAPSLAAGSLPTLALPVAAAVAAARPAAAGNPADAARPRAPRPLNSVERVRRLQRRIENTPGRAAALLGGFFDGNTPLSAADSFSPADLPAYNPPGRGWRQGLLESGDGTPLVYHRRGPGNSLTPPRVYVGGLALAQSFDVHFEKGPAPKGLEYRTNLRGLPPSGWSPTRAVIDADARDLARLIRRAAAEAGSARVDLALHSYAALALQRMVQLDEEPEIKEALALLKGARVTLFGPTTHIPGSEALMGRGMQSMAWGLRRFVESIDYGDALARHWNAMARWNPFLLPYAASFDAAWQSQRRAALALAIGDIERMLKQDLSEPWPQDIEPLRRRLLAEVDLAARHSEWQEAALRRVRDGFALDFDDASAARLRSLGARLRVVYSHGDALIPWSVERLLLKKLGIDAPRALPKAGTVLRGPGGTDAVIAAGGHYSPLLRYDTVPEHLER